MLPDLIDAARMDSARLKATCGCALSFQGAVSVQQLLPKSSPTKVRFGACVGGGDYLLRSWAVWYIAMTFSTGELSCN